MESAGKGKYITHITQKYKWGLERMHHILVTMKSEDVFTSKQKFRYFLLKKEPDWTSSSSKTTSQNSHFYLMQTSLLQVLEPGRRHREEVFHF